MKIVVVGGGFAGINFAKSLAGKDGMEVVLVDQNNYNFFPPLIYQVATAFIEPSNISLPFRRMFQHKSNIHFYNAKFLEVVPDRSVIKTDKGELAYDRLVLALGTETNFFGLENVKKNALVLKNINDALAIRNAILLTLEKACRVSDLEEQKRLLTVVVSGGGPTGVEIAGMMAEMSEHIIHKDYPELKRVKTRIILVDAAPTLLGPMRKKSQDEALKQLKKLGVEVLLSVAVKDFEHGIVHLANGNTIETPNLIWVSGVIATEVKGLPTQALGQGRRVLVDEFCKVEGLENVFAIGDIALMKTNITYPKGHPQLAQPAIQQGKRLAKNIINIQNGGVAKKFVYRDKGTMAIISKFKAVVDLPKGFLKGWIAWLAWLFIHIMPIAGFRNRIKLFFSWMWSFITNDPTIRLIIQSELKKKDILN